MKDHDTLCTEATVPAEEAESASYLLSQLGCGSILESPSDDGSTVTLLANFDPAIWSEESLLAEARAAFKNFPGLADARIAVRRESVADQSEIFKQHFAPFEIAQGIMVVPSWERYESRAGESVINLDPGMAFGTGLHETTRLCAGALASYARELRSLLDVGTGSGILAIAGRLLGIKRICAVDNDPDALEVARANLDKNGCGDVKTLASVEMAEARFDAVVANILLSTLLELREAIIPHVAEGGLLILSGITREQEAEIISAYGSRFRSSEVRRDGEWSAVIFKGEA